MVISGHQWSSEVISACTHLMRGEQLSSMNISGPQWSSVVISACTHLMMEAIGGPQRPSEALSGPQRHSYHESTFHLRARTFGGREAVPTDYVSIGRIRHCRDLGKGAIEHVEAQRVDGSDDRPHTHVELASTIE